MQPSQVAGPAEAAQAWDAVSTYMQSAQSLSQGQASVSEDEESLADVDSASDASLSQHSSEEDELSQVTQTHWRDASLLLCCGYP